MRKNSVRPVKIRKYSLRYWQWTEQTTNLAEIYCARRVGVAFRERTKNKIYFGKLSHFAHLSRQLFLIRMHEKMKCARVVQISFSRRISIKSKLSISETFQSIVFCFGTHFITSVLRDFENGDGYLGSIGFGGDLRVRWKRCQFWKETSSAFQYGKKE